VDPTIPMFVFMGRLDAQKVPHTFNTTPSTANLKPRGCWVHVEGSGFRVVQD
jgi:hypothetical protein